MARKPLAFVFGVIFCDGSDHPNDHDVGGPAKS